MKLKMKLKMELKISAQHVLKFLNILSWIIFLGLCIEAGGILFNAIFTHFINPIAANHFWEGINFSNLYQQDKSHFFVIVTLMTIVAVMKALLFYFIVKTLNYKKFDVSEPFNTDFRNMIRNISYATLAISLFSFWGINYTKWLISNNIKMPDMAHLHFDGADVWLLMSVVLFVIAQIFKRGIELQEENALTI